MTRTRSRYLLRDTLKVWVANVIGLTPALGIFFVNEADPTGGGTGHTIRICELEGVPVAALHGRAGWSRSRDRTKNATTAYPTLSPKTNERRYPVDLNYSPFV